MREIDAVKPLRRILETCLYGDDLEAMETFYTRLLETEPLTSDPGHYVFYKLDGCMLLLFNPARCQDNEDIPPHGARGQGHMAFRVEEAELPAWKTRLAELGIPLEMDHLWDKGPHSLYFRDPAGNSLEIAPMSLWEQ